MADAVEMLREDHEKVKNLFDEFEDADAEEKEQIVRTAINELTIHATLEEELFYPVVRQVIDDEEQMDEALEEHHVAKLLIAELENMKPSDERFDAKFNVLAESVRHHIEEEESEVLPKAEKSDEIDLQALGEQMMERKQELQEELERPRRKSSRRTSARRQAQPKAETSARKNTAGAEKYRRSA
jgi:hemerythrin-like domain-containing protein